MEKEFELLPNPDAFNVNKRYYTKEALENSIEEYKQRITEGKALVMMGSPSEGNEFSVDLNKVVGQVTDIEFKDGKYMSTIKFDRPTKKVSQILDGRGSFVVGLNQVGHIDANNEVSDLRIVSASIIYDPRLQVDPFEDLAYFIEQFKQRPQDHRIRNQLITLIDAIYTKAKVEHEQEKN